MPTWQDIDDALSPLVKFTDIMSGTIICTLHTNRALDRNTLLINVMAMHFRFLLDRFYCMSMYRKHFVRQIIIHRHR